jgi:hypothetical protein
MELKLFSFQKNISIIVTNKQIGTQKIYTNSILP